MEAKVKRLREKLSKHRQKIVLLETEAAEMEQEIKKAEEEQLGYLARSAANSLSGGMEEIFEILRGLRAKPSANTAVDETATQQNNDDKEGETVEDTDETDDTQN